MPVAESGPAGFTVFDNRQLSARQFQKQILAEVSFQEQRIAEFAGRKPLPHLDDGRLEAAFVADTQLDAGLLHGGKGGLRVRRGRAERLLAEDVASGLRGRDDLPGVPFLRRAENDGVDLGIRQRILKSRCGLDAERRSRCARRIHGDRYPARA